MHLRIATYNIHKCIGRDGITETDRIVSVLRELDADIIALQEVSSTVISQSQEVSNMLSYLARETGMEPVEGYTLTVEGAQYGNALLTRISPIAVKRIDISFKGREPRGIIQAHLEINNLKIVLWATHLGLGIRERHWQVKKLLKIIETTDGDIRILLGDFNEWLSWGRPLRALHRLFRTVPSPASFPSARPFLKLDRIWVHPVDKLKIVRAHMTQISRLASDHVPIVADLHL